MSDESRRTVLGLRSRETFSSEQENRRLQNIDHTANLRVRSISRRNVSQARRRTEAQSQFALSTVPFSITTRSHIDVEHGRRRATARVRFSISTHRKTRIHAWNANKENALRIPFFFFCFVCLLFERLGVDLARPLKKWPIEIAARTHGRQFIRHLGQRHLQHEMIVCADKAKRSTNAYMQCTSIVKCFSAERLRTSVAMHVDAMTLVEQRLQYDRGLRRR